MFNQDNFSTLTVGNKQVTLQGGEVIGSPTLYSYQTTDSTAQVVDTDYFVNVDVSLQVDDLIYIVASDSKRWYTVVAVDIETRNVIIAYEPYEGPVPLPISLGGTNAISMGSVDGVAYYDGTKISTTAVGSAGQVLQSNGPGSAPTFVSVSAGGVTSVAGNTGPGLGGNIAVRAIGSSAQFVSGVSKVDMDFTADPRGNLTMGSVLNPSYTGDSNCAFGQTSLIGATTASFNAGFGTRCLELLTTGSHNVAVGLEAMKSAITADSNTAIGYQSSFSLDDGSFNATLGYRAGYSMVDTVGNVLIGANAGLNTVSGANLILIGPAAGINYTLGYSGNIVIGDSGGLVGEENVIRVGFNGKTSQCYIMGIYGTNAGVTANVATVVSNNQLGSATIVGGTGISVTPGANSITISYSGGAPSFFPWTLITSSTTASPNNGYICSSGSTLFVALPSVAAVGAIVEVTDVGSITAPWTITQGAGQNIRMGNYTTTVGTGGSLQALNVSHSIRLLCVIANTSWVALSSSGNFNLV
jgi:hypothetical protein